VKKSSQKYRDRAAERRDGDTNDYAQVRNTLLLIHVTHVQQVESILEDLEKRNAAEDRSTARIH
jgi:hypothetical protein